MEFVIILTYAVVFTCLAISGLPTIPESHEGSNNGGSNQSSTTSHLQSATTEISTSVNNSDDNILVNTTLSSVELENNVTSNDQNLSETALEQTGDLNNTIDETQLESTTTVIASDSHEISSDSNSNQSQIGDFNVPSNENLILNDNENTATAISETGCVENATEHNELLIRRLKRNILAKLGMKQEPDISNLNTTVQERRNILRLYRKSLEVVNEKKRSAETLDDEDLYKASEQFNSFSDAGDWPDNLKASTRSQAARHSPKRIYFNIDITEPEDPNLETTVTSAKLSLFKLRVRPQNLILTDLIDKAVRIDVYQIIYVPSTPEQSSGRWLKKSLDSRLVSVTSGNGWEQFNIRSAVQDWIRDPSTNYGLEIVADSRYVTDDVIDWVLWREGDLEGRSGEVSSYLPSLDVLTRHKAIMGRRRVERDAAQGPRPGDCEAGQAGEGPCCRDKLEIDVRNDLNWGHWILEPKSYTAYYCKGSCPAGHRVASRFSEVKSKLIAANPFTPVTVQCTATRLSSLSIVHYNDQGVLTVSILEDMFADQCMCT